MMPEKIIILYDESIFCDSLGGQQIREQLSQQLAGAVGIPAVVLRPASSMAQASFSIRAMPAGYARKNLLTSSLDSYLLRCTWTYECHERAGCPE